MFIQTIVIGAGPAGLQIGYFLEQGGYPYKILEKAASAAAFFDQYPHSGKLISINKKYTGSDDPEFNMRHDWNSLITHKPMRFTSYSDEYYPEKEKLHQYLNDYAREHALKIQYSTKVTRVDKEANGHYKVTVTHNKQVETYTCEKLICATGLGVPNIPDIKLDVKRPIKHYAEYGKDYFRDPKNLEQFRNKSLLIVGNGNSAFELAKVLNSLCSTISIFGKHRTPWAMATHYVGDLRATYLEFYDGFLLKSLNAASNDNSNQIYITQKTTDSLYFPEGRCQSCPQNHLVQFTASKGFDHVIFCTGWKSDLSFFSFKVPMFKENKYPAITFEYESVEHKNLYFLGALGHSLDYKKTSGGFIHGFRYLIEYFFHTVYDKKFIVKSFQQKQIQAITNHILDRINTGSAMYQLPGFMGDILLIDTKTQKCLYFEDVHPTFTDRLLTKNLNKIIIGITLEYGEIETDLKKLGKKESDIGTESAAKLLHPIFRVLKDSDSIPNNLTLYDCVHLDEDILADFRTNIYMYEDRIVRFLKGYLQL